MVKWTSKKSTWPILSALGCLFVLAVFAPQAWDRYQSKLPHHRELSLFAESGGTIAMLPPEPQSVRAVLVPSQDVIGPELPPVEVEPFEVVTIEAETPAENIQIVALPPAPSEPALAKPEFDFNVLLQMRDALMAMVDRLPQPSPPVVQPQAKVRVHSESDRLAMVNRREPAASEWNEHSWAAPEIVDTVTMVPLGGGIVGEILEEFKQPEQQPLEVPQVALNDITPAPATAPAQNLEPTLIPLPPVVESISDPTPPREPLLRFRPNQLFKQLDLLSQQSLTEEWSGRVHQQIARLSDDHTTPLAEALPILEDLETLAVSGRSQANRIEYSMNQHQWFQAIQSLERRLAIWHVLLDPAVEAKNSIVSETHAPELLAALSDVAVLLQNDNHGEQWRDYLLLDKIATATSEGAAVDQQGRCKLAQSALNRMATAQLTAEQKSFLATKPLVKLQLALQPWAATAVNLDRLAALIERYETGRELRFAVAIAKMQQQLRWSNAPELQALANHLDLHYRGSNLRLAVTDDLMNQMMPKQKPVVSPVHENIAGANVRGKSRTTTNLRIRLIPDPKAWRFDFEASGKVYSNTRSETWPARVRNAAKMQYQVVKTITIDQNGLNVAPAKANAQGRHELLGVDSQLDSVPLFGTLLREIARSKNKKSRSKAMSQVKKKVIRQAQQRMDREANPKFEKLEQKFRAGILGPVEKLALVAEPRSMFTTEDRAVMQLRLANTGQLAAHTPRPLAPSDSVASMQMHETVLNNALAGLQLDGRRMKVTELFEFFAQKLGRPGKRPSEDLSKRAIVQFAARDAILVNCDNDRVELVLNIREVALGRDKIRNFQVHAYFRPVLHGIEVRLVRDGTLQFAGRRLMTGPRVVLHGVFGKLLEKDAEIRLLAGTLQEDPRLKGLMVTQLVIQDGWIGLALGPAHPERTAWRTLGPNATTMMR